MFTVDSCALYLNLFDILSAVGLVVHIAKAFLLRAM